MLSHLKTDFWFTPWQKDIVTSGLCAQCTQVRAHPTYLAVNWTQLGCLCVEAGGGAVRILRCQTLHCQTSNLILLFRLSRSCYQWLVIYTYLVMIHYLFQIDDVDEADRNRKGTEEKGRNRKGTESESETEKGLRAVHRTFWEMELPPSYEAAVNQPNAFGGRIGVFNQY